MTHSRRGLRTRRLCAVVDAHDGKAAQPIMIPVIFGEADMRAHRPEYVPATATYVRPALYAPAPPAPRGKRWGPALVALGALLLLAALCAGLVIGGLHLLPMVPVESDPTVTPTTYGPPPDYRTAAATAVDRVRPNTRN